MIAFMQVVAGCLSGYGYSRLSRAFTNDRGTHPVCCSRGGELEHFLNVVLSKCFSAMPRWRSVEESRASDMSLRQEAFPPGLHTL